MMKRIVWLGLLLGIMLLGVAGCRGGNTAVVTPTPFPSNELVVRALPGEPIPVSLAYLAENPTYFEGATLQVTGQYQRLPLLVCDRDPHPPPYTWGLTDDTVLAQAGGLDSTLRPLAPDGLTITVQGTWQRWRGPVGCGKDAPVKEVWYLAVSRLLDPSPLLKVTLTPAGVAETNPDDNIVPTTEIVEGEPQPVTPLPPLEPTAVLTPTLPLPEATPVPPAYDIPPTATFLPTATGSGVVTATATTAPGSGTATPTSTPGPSPTAGSVATATQSAGSGLEGALTQGSLDYRDLAVKPLESGTRHRWNFRAETAGTGNTSRLIVSVAPGNPAADIVLSLYTADGTAVITDVNTSGPGSVEMIDDYDVAAEADYALVIGTAGGTQTDYALIIQDADDSFYIAFQGRLTPNQPANGNITAESDHFWFFTTTQGQQMTLRVQPNTASADAYLELYDSTGVRQQSYDEGAEGELEEFSFTPTASGLYSIRIGEYSYGDMAYTITLTSP